MKSRTQLETENYELKQENKKLKELAAVEKLNSQIRINSFQTKFENELEEIKVDMSELKDNINKKKAQIDSDAIAYNILSSKYSKLENELCIQKKLNKSIQNILLRKENKIVALNAKLNLDSHNSSKPSSSDGLKTVIHNSRTKTSRLQGGQLGHAFSTLELSDKPTHTIKLKKCNCCSCGEKIIYENEPERRQIIKIKFSYEIVEYQGYNGHCPNCDKQIHATFPKKVSSKVQYDNSVKAFSIMLTDFANVPNRKVKQIIAALTKTTGPSIGSIDAWKNQTYNLAHYVCKRFKHSILKESVIHSDETPIKINGNRFNYAIGAFSDKYSIIECFKNRSKKSFEKMGILAKYKHKVVHDHLKLLYNLGNYENSECNAHIDRKLQSIIEISNRDSAKKFRSFLYSVKYEVDNGAESKLDDDRYACRRNEMLQILDEWDIEFYTATNGKNLKYFTDEKNLKKQLREYIDNHLMFAKYSEVEFTNNLAERGLRPIKSKLKVNGGFRNIAYANGYSQIQSIIDTSRKNRINMLDVLTDLICGKKVISNL